MNECVFFLETFWCRVIEKGESCFKTFILSASDDALMKSLECRMFLRVAFSGGADT